MEAIKYLKTQMSGGAERFWVLGIFDDNVCSTIAIGLDRST